MSLSRRVTRLSPKIPLGCKVAAQGTNPEALRQKKNNVSFILQKFYEFEAMNQYQPPPPVSQPPTASPTTSDIMGPPPPHLYPLPTSECWPPHSSSGPSVISEANESTSMPPLCAGCRLRIEDKFYLSAVDVKWHSACLKCAECGVELETQSSCFEKDGHIYCKDDYRRYVRKATAASSSARLYFT